MGKHLVCELRFDLCWCLGPGGMLSWDGMSVGLACELSRHWFGVWYSNGIGHWVQLRSERVSIFCNNCQMGLSLFNCRNLVLLSWASNW